MEVSEVVSVVFMLLVAVGAVRLLRSNPVIARQAGARLRKPTTWLIGAPTLALILAVGIPYVDAHVLNGPPPKPLSFADLVPSPAAAGGDRTPVSTFTSTTAAAASAASATTTTAPTALRTGAPARTGSAVSTASALPSDPMAGTWRVGPGTEARYGIDDTAMGQTSHVVGRTHLVSGVTEIVGYTVTSTRVVVDMQSVTCQCVHDSKYRQMLETSKYPTSTFVLTRPVALSVIPATGAVIDVPVTGNFTIHGVTRPTTFTLKATRIGPRIAVMASIPVKLSDYNIQSPNGGSFGGLSNCTIDFLIAYDRTS